MVSRSIIGILSLVFLAAGVLLQFFTILSGAITSSPIDKFYFLEASNIGNIPGARNPSRWTFFAICGANGNGHNANCGNVVPALPFDPPRNFGTTQNVPQPFIGTHKFYYLSRFMFAFYLMALFFSCIGLMTGVLALCSRLGGYLAGLTVALALFFQTLAAALMTAWTVKGRNAFRSAGHSAHLGKYLYGFTWAAMACFLISTILFCIAGSVGRERSSGVSRKRSTRSNRSRGSFLDTGSAGKSREDYS
ncbi:SUR7-domain-containing protein [Pleomassaria siparia CBS 279.74]|uniref:SUR7-domain-containing protein n=1 Tax=Pleomassaria siparia CBS 279.74 TaxID=1314801 RepID=A0A6G1JTL7_9PLEO|nr:SUR7-domain-containing protein [Pleomassaria siparia CBS 279.74]